MNRVLLAERMGWTLDYVDSLDMQEYERVLTILDAVDKAKAHVQQRQQRQGRNR